MKKIKELLSRLNENQQAAVTGKEEKSIVVAGPGSGKTSVVAARTIWLVEEKKVKPERIMVLTFSKAAAKEMEARAVSQGGSGIKKVQFSTIHALAYRMLMEFTPFDKEKLLTEKNSLELFTRSVAAVSSETARDKEAVLQLMNEVGYLKNTYGNPSAFRSEILTTDRFARVCEKYEEKKRAEGRLDFDDLLLDAAKLLTENGFIRQKVRSRFDEVIVDEFQDINPIQFDIIKALAEDKGLMVVGDEDQSIYGFRGSVPDIMVNFQKIYPESARFFLEENYRVPEAIMERASQLIKNNTHRFEKQIHPVKSGGKKPEVLLCADFQTEGQKIAEQIGILKKEGHLLSEIAVLYRNNSQGAILAESLANGNIPYEAPDGIYTVYDHWIWKDIYAYVKIASGVGTERDLVQIINKPLRYIKRASIEAAAEKSGDFLTNLINHTPMNPSQTKNLEKLISDIGKLSKLKSPKEQLGFIRVGIGYEEYLKTYAEETGALFENMKEVLDSIYEAACSYESIDAFLSHSEEMKNKLMVLNQEEDRVLLMTMHRSKGLEYKTVFISGAVEGLAPSLPKEKGRVVNIDEERRLFYVAMTRAKERLVLSVPAKRFGRSVEPSRFLAEIDGKAVVKSGVKNGTKVYHKIFGEGNIMDRMESDGKTLLTINFNGTLRKLDLETCQKNGNLNMLES